jgi:hypothetical protein
MVVVVSIHISIRGGTGVLHCQGFGIEGVRGYEIHTKKEYL